MAFNVTAAAAALPGSELPVPKRSADAEADRPDAPTPPDRDELIAALFMGEKGGGDLTTVDDNAPFDGDDDAFPFFVDAAAAAAAILFSF